ncbi:MAG: WD40 repeat domain-containing protein [Planctomycetia bacterium]|nr:WD40 repeat domain-containing protein [Planctomycetia bacterium]
MADEFNPYYEWLGIPLEDQPADHYRLLGLKKFEENPKVIQNAADRQVSHVRTFLEGDHAVASEKLLKELEKARLTLLDMACREAYNEALRLVSPAPPPVLPAKPVSPPKVVAVQPVLSIPIPPLQVEESPRKKDQKPRSSTPPWVRSPWLWGGCLCLGILLLFGWSRENDTDTLVGNVSVEKPVAVSEKEPETPEEMPTVAKNLSETDQEESLDVPKPVLVQPLKVLDVPTSENSEEVEESKAEFLESEEPPVVEEAVEAEMETEEILPNETGWDTETSEETGLEENMSPTVSVENELGEEETAGTEEERSEKTSLETVFSPPIETDVPSNEKEIVAFLDGEKIYIHDMATAHILHTLNANYSSASVRDVAIAPGDKLLASCDEENIRLWSLETGKELAVWVGDADRVELLTFSADGQRLFSVTEKNIQMWDVRTRKQVGSHQQQNRIQGIKVSPDGKLMITLDYQKNVTIYSLTDGTSRSFSVEVKNTTGRSYVSSDFFEMTPDNRYLLTCVRDGVYFWSMATGKLVKKVAHPEPVKCVAVSSDGNWMATSCDDEVVRIYDLHTEKIVRTFVDQRYEQLAFSTDKTYLVMGQFIWSLETGRKVGNIGTPNTFYGLSRFATSKIKKNIPSPKRREKPEKRRSVADLISVPDAEGTPVKEAAKPGNYLAALVQIKRIEIWNLKTQQKLHTLVPSNRSSTPVSCVAFSPDGKRLVSCDRLVRVWDMESGRELKQMDGHTSTIHSVCFSADGKKVWSAGADGFLKVWDARTGMLLGAFQQEDGVVSVIISPNGKMVVARNSHNVITLYNATNGKVLRFFKAELKAPTMRVITGSYFTTKITKDNRSIITCNEKNLFSWSLKTGKLQGQIPHPDKLLGVTLSEDGKWMATSCQDRKVRVYNVQSSKLQQTFDATCHTLEFTPDGKFLMCGGILWDVEGEKKVVDLGYFYNVAVSPVELDFGVSEELPVGKK